MKVVIQHVPGKRTETFGALLSAFPDAIVIECTGDPMETFRRSLIADPHWHIEDDAIPAPDFWDRSRAAIEVHPDWVLNGFALNQRSGNCPASTFMSAVCFYLPAGYGPLIAEYSRRWNRLLEHKTGFDLVIRDWLVSRKERYWQVSPSLVQHAVGGSLLGPRSSFRASPTYIAHYGRKDMRKLVNESTGQTQKLWAVDIIQCPDALASIGKADVVYCDPPCGPGPEKTFRKRAGLPPPGPFSEFAESLGVCIGGSGARHIFVEHGIDQQYGGMMTEAIRRNMDLPQADEWSTVYGSPKRTARVSYWGDMPMLSLDGLGGQLLVKTAIKAVGSGKMTVADPCIGLGMTSRVAHHLGHDCIGTEIDPARLERTAQWLLANGYSEQDDG